MLLAVDSLTGEPLLAVWESKRNEWKKNWESIFLLDMKREFDECDDDKYDGLDEFTIMIRLPGLTLLRIFHAVFACWTTTCLDDDEVEWMICFSFTSHKTIF